MYTKTEFQRVKRQLLPIHPALAGAKVRFFMIFARVGGKINFRGVFIEALVRAGNGTKIGIHDNVLAKGEHKTRIVAVGAFGCNNFTVKTPSLARTLLNSSTT